MTAKHIVAHTRILVTPAGGKDKPARVAEPGEVLAVGKDVTDDEAKTHLDAGAAASAPAPDAA